jgi:hypothetical protein
MISGASKENKLETVSKCKVEVATVLNYKTDRSINKTVFGWKI